MTIWSEPPAGTELQALLAAVKGSPIVVRPVVQPPAALRWSAVRRSGNADAYVLAWIASHVRGAVRPPRVLM